MLYDFLEGNYIVNSIDYNRIFILDNKLEKILRHMPFKFVNENNIYHDVRVISTVAITINDNKAGRKQ